jgi:hypothetical protein
MTNNRSKQNPQGNSSQHHGVELYKAAQWDQRIIVTPDDRDERCNQFARQMAFAFEAWEAGSRSRLPKSGSR